ncbi:MAG: elongation factor Ts [Prevotella sp.]|nr:elongation factor Ts [Prevotella sp.]
MAYKANMDDIKKLRTMTGAGLGDVKKALEEAEGDFDKAKDLLRERGLAIAAKRSDRETSNGCVLVKKVSGFAAMVAVKCETDFVANGADFIAMTQSILDAAIEARCKNLDEVKALTLANGETAEAVVTQRSGITGEKMELDGYNFIEGDNVDVYDHMGKHTLCTMVQLNKNNEDAAHKVAMQVAAMKPVALNAESIDPQILEEEYKTAIEKSKLEQVQKFVDMQLKKAGINPAHVDSEDHIESNTTKGWITKEQADEARKIIAEAKAEGEAQLKMPMIEGIARGRVEKFKKESCLVDQEFQFGDGDKATVQQWLAQQDKELQICDFKRFTLVAE